MKMKLSVLLTAAMVLSMTACTKPTADVHDIEAPTVFTETMATNSSTTESEITTSTETFTTEAVETNKPTEIPVTHPVNTGNAETAVTIPEETAVTVPEETTTAPHEHSHQLTSSTESTCTEDGRQTYSCSCGDSYTKAYPATGHNWGPWEITREPTVSAEGESQRCCNSCSTTETKTIDKLPPPEAPEVIIVSQEALQQIEDGFLMLVNQERDRVGVKELSIHSHLDTVAQIRSGECIEKWSHTRPNGQPFFSAIDRNEYSYSLVGENLCMTSHIGNGVYAPSDKWVGSPTQIEAAYTWMFQILKNSPGHYENMINEFYTQCGIGISYVTDPDLGIPMFYVAHIFGAR